jgi:opacity protein-like surface antigen
MTTRSSRLFILALLVLSPAARAETEMWQRPGPEAGAHASYYHSIDHDADARKWYGGAQFRYHVSHYWAMEATADYRREHYSPGTASDTYPVMGSIVGYPAPHWRVSPYGLAGFGWYLTHTNGPSSFSDTQNRFGPHVGAGLQAFIDQHWSLDGSWRYAWVDDVKTKNGDTTGSRRAPGPPGSARALNADGWIAMCGVKYHW